MLKRIKVKTCFPRKEKCTVSLQNRLGSRTFLKDSETMNSFKAQESIGSEHRISFIMAGEGS